MFHYKDYTTLGIRFAVPFLHVPPVYQNNIQYDPERIGSHKDIFPTLYELALSDMPYLKLGNNLLSLIIQALNLDIMCLLFFSLRELSFQRKINIVFIPGQINQEY